MANWLTRWWKRRKLTAILRPKRRRFLSLRGARARVPVGNDQDGVIVSNGPNIFTMGTRQQSEEDEREKVRPVEVVHLLETDVPVSMEDIEAKLDKLRERAVFFKETLERSVPDDLMQAIVLLEARKNYPKVKEHFPWPTTTAKKIDDLCQRYKLDHHPLRWFMPDLPDQVVSEIQAFKEVFDKAVKGVKIADPKMALSLIAAPEVFSVRKGDPILLAASPFGEFYYVLCAWDKEVDFVGELLVGDLEVTETSK